MQRADAIVVLGCALGPDGAPSSALCRRLELAARAYREAWASRIVTSGGRRWGAHVEAVVMKVELLKHSVPEAAITMELLSLSTAENCYYTAELLRALGAESVVVATCSWHVPRALRNFARFGVKASALPVEWSTTPAASPLRRWRERVNTWADWCMMPRADG